MLIQFGLPDIEENQWVDQTPRPERSEYYVLDERRRAIAATPEEWQSFPREKALVAETRLAGGRVVVATFFNGIDHAFDDPDEAGIFLFETLTQVGEDFSEDGAWRSWDEAAAAHEETVKRYQRLFSKAEGEVR
jgi:hypothetical protein